MSVLPILTFEDETLRKEASTVKTNSENLQQLIDDMFETMYNAKGVGLAGPQIGSLLRIFVADTDVYAENHEEETSHGPVVMINPKICFKSEEITTMEEGCLSIPDVMGPVKRPENIKVTYKNRSFEEQSMRVDGRLARVIQHEIDHLNGILFVDHLSFFKQKLLASKLKEIDEGAKEIDYPVVPKN